MFELENIPFLIAGGIWLVLVLWLIYKYVIIDRR